MNDDPKLNYSTLLEQLMPNGITRKLEARQAFDLRKHPRNFGIGSLDFWWVTKRGDRAVTWRMFSGWYLKQNRQAGSEHVGLGSIDYHSPIELYEGQYQTRDKCEHTGGPCFSDGTSFTDGEFEQFLLNPDSLWRELEKRLVELETRVATAREDAKGM